jgi:AP-1-like transcription factor
VKDLETKVKELERAAQATTSENSQLRAQVDKMTMELGEYKKRLSVADRPSRSLTGPRPVFGHGLVNNLNDVNFQFEFPKFGSLPGPSPSNNGIQSQQHSPSLPSPGTSFGLKGQPSPSEKSKDEASPGTQKSRENSDVLAREALAQYSSIFSGNTPYDGSGSNASRTSLDSASYSQGGTNTASPSASSNSNSNSNGGPTSSCDTSPEPYTQSPLGFKPVDTLTTIGEEQSVTVTSGENGKFSQPPSHQHCQSCSRLAGFNNFSTFDVNNFDWIAQQNGGKFDPQLFGDYREPQDNIISNNLFDDSFFNDAFDTDFITAFNVAPSPNLPKKNLVAEIDAINEKDDSAIAHNGKLLTCNNIWYVVCRPALPYADSDFP